MMVLARECFVVEAPLVGDQGAEVQVVVIEEIVKHIHVEGLLCRRDFSPLDFKGSGEAMGGLYLADAVGNFGSLVGRAPEGAKNHKILAVVLEVAAFVSLSSAAS